MTTNQLTSDPVAAARGLPILTAYQNVRGSHVEIIGGIGQTFKTVRGRTAKGKYTHLALRCEHKCIGCRPNHLNKWATYGDGKWNPCDAPTNVGFFKTRYGRSAHGGTYAYAFIVGGWYLTPHNSAKQAAKFSSDHGPSFAVVKIEDNVDREVEVAEKQAGWSASA